MDAAERARFILSLHKHSLQAFDAGGTVLSGPSTAGTQNAVNPNTGLSGAVSGFLGLNNQFQASGAPIQQGTNVGQINQAYTGAQNALGMQGQFANQAAGQGGFGNQSQVFGQQQALANQLQQQAMGQGPNPAQAALAQATGQNTANQAALMASARGASVNPGLIARQAAQQGAATQQQSVGQAATLQAQQQLAAQAALANQQAQMQGVAANQIAAQGQGATNYGLAQQGEQGIVQNANTAANNANVGMQGNINNVNAQTAASNQNMAGNVFSGIGKLVSNIPVIGSLFKAEGGEIESPHYPSAMFAEGGITEEPLPQNPSGPQSFAGQWLSGAPVSTQGPSMPSTATNPQFQKMGLFDGGKGQGGADVSNLASLLPLAKGGQLASKGGKVKPGDKSQKAVKEDDSYENDKVPALLSEGEIVIPRHITQHPQAAQKAAEFVQAVLNKKRMGVK